MGKSGTSKRSRRARRYQPILRWALGSGLVGLGAFVGAFGTIAWLFVLRVPSVTVVLLGMLFLGAAPLCLGLGLLWAGLHVLESELARGRIWTLPESQIVEAAGRGMALRDIVIRLGGTDAEETERRLDDLVVRDLLAMDVTEQGEVVYLRRPTLEEAQPVLRVEAVEPADEDLRAWTSARDLRL